VLFLGYIFPVSQFSVEAFELGIYLGPASLRERGYHELNR